MSRAIASEILKLRTTRTFYALVGSALLLVLLIAGAVAAAETWPQQPETPPGEDLLGIVGIVQLFALVIGILAIGSEFRHGTITPSLLVVPDRLRLMNAKLVVQLAAGLLFGAVTFVAVMVLASVILGARDIDSGLSGSALLELAVGGILAVGLYAALGLAVGALIRNQVGAIVGALAYVFVIEGLLTLIPGIDDVISKYGLGGVTEGLTATSLDPGSDRIGQLPAGLLLALYAAILFVAGALAVRRRDVSA